MAAAPGGLLGRVTRAVARWARRHLALWFLVAGAVDTALVALVAVLIALPGQSDRTISILILAFLALLLLSIVFPVAGRVVEGRDRVAEQGLRRLELAGERDQVRRDRIDQLLVLGSSAGLPRMSQLANDVLGATPTRYSIGDNAPYVEQRLADAKIRWLLAASGPPYPFVIVWGTTKAGKSRTLAEALRATFAHDPVVILPRDGQGLAELVHLGVQNLVEHLPAVVVLDDLSPAGLEVLTPEVLEWVRRWAVIAATMTAHRRADVLASGEVGAVARAALAAVSGEYELTSWPPTGTEKAEAERLYPMESFDGSIAETLVGARELIARYKASQDSHPAGCAVLRAAIDARRAGLSRAVTDAELWRLFPAYLHAVQIGLFPTTERFNEGIEWAARPVASQVALLRRANPGQEPAAWIIFDHAVTADEGHDDNPPRPVPTETWADLIDVISERDAFAVGIAAYTSHETAAAVAAFRKAGTLGHADPGPGAHINLGVLLDEQDDTQGAQAAYQKAIDSGHPDVVPLAARNLGNLLKRRGDVDGAQAAYQLTIDSGHPDQSALAMVNLGVLLSEQGDTEGAQAAYQQAIDSGHPDMVPAAAIDLGVLAGERGDMRDAQAAYQRAIDSGHPDYAPTAAYNLGNLLDEQGDTEGAQVAYQKAIDSGHPDAAPAAARNLGNLLQQRGDVDGARATYQKAIDSGDPNVAPTAMYNLGNLLIQQDDIDGARTAYERAIDSGHSDAAPNAAARLAGLLMRQGDVDCARAAYQQAIDSGHPDMGAGCCL